MGGYADLNSLLLFSSLVLTLWRMYLTTLIDSEHFERKTNFVVTNKDLLLLFNHGNNATGADKRYVL